MTTKPAPATTDYQEEAKKLVDNCAISTRRGTGRRAEHIDVTADMEFLATKIAALAVRAHEEAIDEAATLVQLAAWLAEIPTEDKAQQLVSDVLQKAADAIRSLKGE